MSNHLPPLERLHFIERELSTLLRANRKSWVKIGKLLVTIEKESLYVLKHSSFTKYVQALAWENKVNVSTFWRAKSAITTYAHIARVENYEQLSANTVKTTPEQLELYNKLKTVVPERILREVRESVLKGKNVRKELSDLWKIYKPLKKGKTERGRKPNQRAESSHTNGSTQVAEHDLLNAEEKDALIDLSKQSLFNFSEQEIEKANILNALRAKRWLTQLVDCSSETKRSDFLPLRINHTIRFDFFSWIENSDSSLNEFALSVGVLILQSEEQLHLLDCLKCHAMYTNYMIAFVNHALYKQHTDLFNRLPAYIGVLSTPAVFTDKNNLLSTVEHPPSYRGILPANKLSLYEAIFRELVNW